jgi:hypothetical protein
LVYCHVIRVLHSRQSLSFTTGNEVEDYYDNGNDQQDVNESAQRVTAYKPQRP